MISIKFDTSKLKLPNSNDIQSLNTRSLRKISKVGQMILETKARTISTTGKLVNSIDSESNSKKATIFSREPHSNISMETGRKPGKMPPINQLKRWSRLKLGNPGLAYVVARKIAREGTNKHKKGGPKLVTQTVDKLQKESIKIYNQEFKKL